MELHHLIELYLWRMVDRLYDEDRQLKTEKLLDVTAKDISKLMFQFLNEKGLIEK